MASLTQTAAIFKKYWYVPALILLFILLITLILIRFTKRETPPTLEGPSLQRVSSSVGNFNLENLSVPKDYPNQLPLYQKGQEPDLKTSAAALAQNLNFQSPPVQVQDKNLGSGLIYSNDQGALTIYPNTISYRKYPTQAIPIDATFPLQDQLSQKALDFVTSAGLSNSLKFFEINYYKTIDEFQEVTTDQGEAAFATLAFNTQIDNMSLIASQSPALLITFDKSGSVTSFTYTSLSSNQTTTVYPIVSPKEAAAKLTRGLGSLIQLSTPNTYNPPAKNLGSINLTKAELAYYFSKDQDIIQPVWIFYGNSEGNGQLNLIWAVAAIPEDLIQSP